MANYLGSFENFLSHGRAVTISDARDKGIVLRDFGDDVQLAKVVDKMFLSIKETFNRQPQIARPCENHKGHGSVSLIRQVAVPVQHATAPARVV